MRIVDNPWANGRSIETLRGVAAGIVPRVNDFEVIAEMAEFIAACTSRPANADARVPPP